MKITVTEKKNSPVGFNSRFEQAEETISQLFLTEDQSIEIIQSEEQKKNK